MIPIADLPVAEYEQRLTRLRNRLDARGIAGALIGTGSNLTYFSGYPSPTQSLARPFFCLLPVAGDPIFFTHTGHEAESRQFSRVADVRTYRELSHCPVDLVRDAISESGLLGKTIGMELGFEQPSPCSHLDLVRLQQALEGTSIVDISAILWSLRTIKSPHEIECIRRACQVVTESYAVAFERVRGGVPEVEVYQAMRAEIERLSAGGQIFLAITSGVGRYDLVTKPPDRRPLQDGELVWMDAGCTIQGYWSDFSRAAVVGAPSEVQRRAHEAIRKITAEAIRRIRPVICCSEIWRYCMTEIDRLDFSITSSIAQLASRVGHGLGLHMTEPPHLSEQDHTPLASGMTITIEPGVATQYGTFHIEENVVITEDGCEVLSDAPTDLFCSSR